MNALRMTSSLHATQSYILLQCVQVRHLKRGLPLQNLEEMTTAAAEGWDPDKEAADLGRLRAALSAQLEQVEQKMAALGGQTSEQPRPHKSVSNLAKARIQYHLPVPPYLNRVCTAKCRLRFEHLCISIASVYTERN